MPANVFGVARLRVKSIVLLLLLFQCGCISSRIDRFKEYTYPDLTDEVESEKEGGLLKRKYQGKLMYYTERLSSEDKAIVVTTMYCGYGTKPHLVKFRIYGERKMVEHKEWGYSYFQEEVVPFRQESIATNSPMILMLETRDENGELYKSGYISQWESADFFEKFKQEKHINIVDIPDMDSIKIEKVTPCIPVDN